MNIFNRNKLKIESETKEDETRCYVYYYKLKEAEDFRIAFLRKVIGSDICIGKLDTKLIYKKPNDDSKKIIDEVINEFNALGIKYKIKNVKTDGGTTVLGIPIKVSSEQKRYEYIIGFAAESHRLEDIKHIIAKHNMHYFISHEEITPEEALEKFELDCDYYEDEKNVFEYDIFDNVLISQMVVCSSKEDSEFILESISSIKKELDI